MLAHELGHLQHRDHLRRMIADGGGAYLIGLMFGHVTGGAALIYASKTLLFAAHSRESEAAADAFAAATLAKLGARPRQWENCCSASPARKRMARPPFCMTTR